MNIGRRLYYELTTGNIILDTGERSGSIVETTVEQDFQTYKALSERVPSTVGLISLAYGQYSQDFALCNGYRIDLNTHQIVFSYPTEPETPPVYQKPLSVEVEELKEKQAVMQTALDDLIMFGGGV